MKTATATKPLSDGAAWRRPTIFAHCNAPCPTTDPLGDCLRWAQRTRWTTKLTSCSKYFTTDRFRVRNERNRRANISFTVNFFRAATMWVYPDFFAYKSGIYRRSAFGDQTAKGFHSVRLVGWGEERFGLQTTKYWVNECLILLTFRTYRN